MTRPVDTHRFRGAYIIHKASTARARHSGFDAAENEARRLLDTDPHATFVISQECGRVRLPRGTAASGVPITRKRP